MSFIINLTTLDIYNVCRYESCLSIEKLNEKKKH